MYRGKITAIKTTITTTTTKTIKKWWLTQLDYATEQALLLKKLSKLKIPLYHLNVFALWNFKTTRKSFATVLVYLFIYLFVCFYIVVICLFTCVRKPYLCNHPKAESLNVKAVKVIQTAIETTLRPWMSEDIC